MTITLYKTGGHLGLAEIYFQLQIGEFAITSPAYPDELAGKEAITELLQILRSSTTDDHNYLQVENGRYYFDFFPGEQTESTAEQVIFDSKKKAQGTWNELQQAVQAQDTYAIEHRQLTASESTKQIPYSSPPVGFQRKAYYSYKHKSVVCSQYP